MASNTTKLTPEHQTIPMERAIVYRTRGTRHGPITRLMSPGDLGQAIKPFVFLDLFEKDGPSAMMGLHPHSGIATVSYVVEGGMSYLDPDGSTGVIPAGGLEWMMAGRGMWHSGGFEDGRVAGFQLWVALPPELELAPHQASYVAAEAIERDGPARVLLGSFGAARSGIGANLPITYLGVELAPGETWCYVPPAGHSILWIALATGSLEQPDIIKAGEMVVFDGSENAVTFKASTNAHFVLGSAVPHPHELALGYYSVHTNADALAQGEHYIARLGDALRLQERR